MDKFRQSYDELSQGLIAPPPQVNLPKNNNFQESKFSKVKIFLNPQKIYFGITIFISIFLLLIIIKPSFVLSEKEVEKEVEKEIEKTNEIKKQKKLNYSKVLVFSVLLSSPYFIWYFTRKNNH